MEGPPDDATDIDVELAKMLITAIVRPARDVALLQHAETDILASQKISIILYGRQAFPENCFRELSVCDFEHPLANHERLLGSGQHLSFKDDPLHTLSPDRQMLVYMRECNNTRLHGFLADLDQIFAALTYRLIGKIYICFTNSKEWSRDSLLECYTLKFSYSELGEFDIYLEWAGIDDTPLEEKVSMDVFKSLKQFVVGCPQLPDPFYTRLFVSSVDSKTVLEGAWGGNGHGVREALLHFKSRKGSSSGRVARFSCEPPSEEADQGTSDAGRALPPEVFPRSMTPELPQLCSSNIKASDSSEPNLAASPARPRSQSDVSKEKRPPHKKVTSYPCWQDPTDATSGPVTRSYPHGRHAPEVPTENHGDDGDGLTPVQLSSSGSTVAEQPVRGSSRKHSAPPHRFLPFTRKIEGEATVASKYPRLAMIEEVPEDLPPTQRLRTPSQSQETQASANTNPSFSFLDLD